MDFGGGLAVGMGAGIGSGIAVGTATGRNQARQQLYDHIENNGITIQDRFGKPIKTDDFLDEAMGSSTSCCSKNKYLALVLIVLALGLAAALAVYLIR